MTIQFINTNLNQFFHNRTAIVLPECYRAPEANKSYEDTNMHTTIVTNADSLGFVFDREDDRPERTMKTFFAAVTTYLSKKKIAKPDEAVAFELQDIAGNFMFGAAVEYFINEANPDEPGNWNYTMTLNEDEMEDLKQRKNVKTFLAGDEAFKSIMDKMARDIGGFQFERDTYIYDACIIVVESIIDVLRAEAKEGETVDVEMPGYFTGSVAIENGDVVCSLTPDGHMKTIIKEDVMLDA